MTKHNDIDDLARRIAENLTTNLPSELAEQMFPLTGTVSRLAALTVAEDLNHLEAENRWLRRERDQLRELQNG